MLEEESTLERLKKHMDENGKDYYEEVLGKTNSEDLANKLDMRLYEPKYKDKTVSEIIAEITKN